MLAIYEAMAEALTRLPVMISSAPAAQVCTSPCVPALVVWISSGACSMDQYFALEIGMFRLGRRIAIVKTRKNDASPLAGHKIFRMLTFQLPRRFFSADGIYFLHASGKQIAFQGKSPEDIDYDRKALRLICTFQKMINFNVHISA